MILHCSRRSRPISYGKCLRSKNYLEAERGGGSFFLFLGCLFVCLLDYKQTTKKLDPLVTGRVKTNVILQKGPK